MVLRIVGSGGRDRTFNLRIQSPLLCQLRYPRMDARLCARLDVMPVPSARVELAHLSTSGLKPDVSTHFITTASLRTATVTRFTTFEVGRVTSRSEWDLNPRCLAARLVSNEVD